MTTPESSPETPKTIYGHIGQWSLFRSGARNLVYGNGFVQFDMSLGELTTRSCVVRLKDNDLYRVRTGTINRHTLEFSTIYEADDIQAESLPRVVEDAFLQWIQSVQGRGFIPGADERDSCILEEQAEGKKGDHGSRCHTRDDSRSDGHDTSE